MRVPNVWGTVPGRSQARAAAAKASSRHRCPQMPGRPDTSPVQHRSNVSMEGTCVEWGVQGEAALQWEGKTSLKPRPSHSAPNCVHVWFNRNSFLPFPQHICRANCILLKVEARFPNAFGYCPVRDPRASRLLRETTATTGMKAQRQLGEPAADPASLHACTTLRTDKCSKPLP